jgi:hypothetical protein
MSGPGFNLTGDQPEHIHGIHVTEGYFQLFGVPVTLGRTFTPQEDTPNGGKIVFPPLCNDMNHFFQVAARLRPGTARCP